MTTAHPAQQSFFAQVAARLRTMSPAEREAAAAREVEREEAARRAVALVAWRRHLQRAGVPPRALADLSGAELADTLALQAARAWSAGDKAHLVLTGWTGTGKTVAACWALRLAERQRGGYAPALFLPWARLVDSSAAQAAALLREAAAAQVLVVDDVGLGAGAALGDRERRRLEVLADARDAPGRRTAWTTNLAVPRTPEGPSPFALLVGPRVTSRLGRSMLWRDCGRDDLRRGR